VAPARRPDGRLIQPWATNTPIDPIANSTINIATAIQPQSLLIVGRFEWFIPKNPTTNDNGSSTAA